MLHSNGEFNSFIEIGPESQELFRDGQHEVSHQLFQYVKDKPYEEVRGYFVAPTGVGKTVIFARFLEDLRQQDAFEPTLIVTPTKQLVTQTTEEIARQGFGGSIGQVIGWKKDKGDIDVLVTTYSSFRKHVLDSNTAINTDIRRLAIFDEAHHLQGEQARYAALSLSSAALIGCTASPDFGPDRLLSDILPDEIYKVDHRDAVGSGLIAPYSTVLLETGADLSEVPITGNEYHQKSLERAINTNARNEQVARFAISHLSEEKIMFNVGTIAHAEELADMNRALGLETVAVHGRMSPKTQRDIINEYIHGDLPAVAQAKLLAEGFNSPKLSAVINVSPTMSAVKALQRTGRGGRRDPSNPNKVMLVIECMDTNYSRFPILYGDERLTGKWQQTPRELVKTVEERLAMLPEEFMGRKVITNIGQIATMYAENKWVPKVVRTRTKPKTQFEKHRQFDPPFDAPCWDNMDLYMVTRGQSTEPAKKLCSGCTAIEDCLESAIHRGEKAGIWGGASQRQIITLRRVYSQEGPEQGRKMVEEHVVALRAKYTTP